MDGLILMLLNWLRFQPPLFNLVIKLSQLSKKVNYLVHYVFPEYHIISRLYRINNSYFFPLISPIYVLNYGNLDQNYGQTRLKQIRPKLVLMITNTYIFKWSTYATDERASNGEL